MLTPFLLVWLSLVHGLTPAVYESRPTLAGQSVIPLDPITPTYIELGGSLHRIEGLHPPALPGGYAAGAGGGVIRK